MRNSLRLFRSLAILYSCCFSFATTLSADPVYKSQDRKGVPLYSSKPKAKGAQPAKLPEIARASFDQPKVIGLTCVSHGGINCQTGADSDGSVVCYDGFRDAIQRFAMSCSAAKLSLITESEKNKGGTFSVAVRNNSSVQAHNVKVTVADGRVLEGPSDLEPLGSGEYFLKNAEARKLNLQVSCENCP